MNKHRHVWKPNFSCQIMDYDYWRCDGCPKVKCHRTKRIYNTYKNYQEVQVKIVRPEIVKTDKGLDLSPIKIFKDKIKAVGIEYFPEEDFYMWILTRKNGSITKSGNFESVEAACTDLHRFISAVATNGLL